MWYSNTNVKWNDETRIECVHILRRNDVIVIGLHVATWQHASRLPWPRAYGLCLTRSDLRQAAATAMLAPVTSASVGFNQTRRRSSSTSTRKKIVPSPLDQATTHIGCTEGSCVAACACCAQRYRPHTVATSSHAAVGQRLLGRASTSLLRISTARKRFTRAFVQLLCALRQIGGPALLSVLHTIHHAIASKVCSSSKFCTHFMRHSTGAAHREAAAARVGASDLESNPDLILYSSFL